MLSWASAVCGSLTFLASAAAAKPAAAAAGMSPLNNPCVGSTKWSSQPWCDPTLPVDRRVADMVSRMSLAEKIASLDTQTPAIASLGLNAYNWCAHGTNSYVRIYGGVQGSGGGWLLNAELRRWSEATHGLSHVNSSGSTPASTNFAFPITTAMSFNRSLWSATAAAIAREARAFMNQGHAYSTYWVGRDPSRSPPIPSRTLARTKSTTHGNCAYVAATWQ